MKKIIRLGAFTLLLISVNVYAHHPAADIVDEELYAFIDSMVADTPHASLTFDEMGGGMTEMTITTDSLEEYKSLVEEQDLLDYLQYLDGVVTMTLQFNDDGTVTMTINQVS